MPENRKLSGNLILATGKYAAIAIAGMALLIACTQNNQAVMVGYWTPGNSCDQRFFELTTDLKFYQWKWEKKWEGYGRDPDVQPSAYSISDKNEITIDGMGRRQSRQILTGKIERISNGKIKISNVTVKRNDKIVKNAPAVMILTRCDENITKQLKK